MEKQETHAPHHDEKQNTHASPPCPVLGQGMVNLSLTTYKYRGTSDTIREEGKGKKGN
jgi:hypothetical protein